MRKISHNSRYGFITFHNSTKSGETFLQFIPFLSFSSTISLFNIFQTGSLKNIFHSFSFIYRNSILPAEFCNGSLGSRGHQGDSKLICEEKDREKGRKYSKCTVCKGMKEIGQKYVKMLVHQICEWMGGKSGIQTRNLLGF